MDDHSKVPPEPFSKFSRLHCTPLLLPWLGLFQGIFLLSEVIKNGITSQSSFADHFPRFWE